MCAHRAKRPARARPAFCHQATTPKISGNLRKTKDLRRWHKRPGAICGLDTPLLVEWSDGRREAVLFALEEESDGGRFSPHRLAHYCLDLAELFDTDRVVPVSIFLRASPAPAVLALGTDRRRYLTFEHMACRLDQMDAARWLHSDNPVARVCTVTGATAGGASRGRRFRPVSTARNAKAGPASMFERSASRSPRTGM